MKIGLLSQWYDPEPGPASLPGALARELVARGHEVHVVTGFPNYPTGRISPEYRMRFKADEMLDGVHVRRVALYPSHGSSIVGRLLNYGTFAMTALIAGIHTLKDMDAVWISNSPVTVGIPMWGVTRVLRRPTVLHVLDLWPDNIVSSGLMKPGMRTRLATKIVHMWNSSMYRSAQFVATISPGILELLASRGVPREKLRYVPMWADESKFYPSADLSGRQVMQVAEERVVVLYAGTLGGTQAIDTLISACALYPDDAPAIECWIAGSGVREEELKADAEHVTAPNVRIRFLGRVPAAEMGEIMAAADVHYVGLRDDPNSRVTMPSKVQATMATGKPMIMAVKGDAEQVVIDAGIGFTADPGSAQDVAKRLTTAARLGRAGLARMGARSREAYDRNFSLHEGANRIEELASNAIRLRRKKSG